MVNIVNITNKRYRLYKELCLLVGNNPYSLCLTLSDIMLAVGNDMYVNEDITTNIENGFFELLDFDGECIARFPLDNSIPDVKTIKFLIKLLKDKL